MYLHPPTSSLWLQLLMAHAQLYTWVLGEQIWVLILAQCALYLWAHSSAIWLSLKGWSLHSNFDHWNSAPTLSLKTLQFCFAWSLLLESKFYRALKSIHISSICTSYLMAGDGPDPQDDSLKPQCLTPWCKCSRVLWRDVGCLIRVECCAPAGWSGSWPVWWACVCMHACIEYTGSPG
jgi:hypothetical protein